MSTIADMVQVPVVHQLHGVLHAVELCLLEHWGCHQIEDRAFGSKSVLKV